MANATGTPQSALYHARGPSDGNSTRNRSAEQQHSYNSGNPMNYNQMMNGQDPSLARYVPPMLSGTSPTGSSWQNNNMQGGYAYNLPTSFGGFGGFSQFSQNPQPPNPQSWAGMLSSSYAPNPMQSKPAPMPNQPPSPSAPPNTGMMPPRMSMQSSHYTPPRTTPAPAQEQSFATPDSNQAVNYNALLAMLSRGGGLSNGARPMPPPNIGGPPMAGM